MIIPAVQMPPSNFIGRMSVPGAGLIHFATRQTPDVLTAREGPYRLMGHASDSGAHAAWIDYLLSRNQSILSLRNSTESQLRIRKPSRSSASPAIVFV